jgi:hypothetical protein
MSDFNIKVDKSLERWASRLLQMPTYKPMLDRLVRESEDLREQARERWPVARRFKDGQPTRKVHSRDVFNEVTIELLPSRISVRFGSAARYVYWIRSHLTGLTQREQMEVSKIREGEDLDDVTLRVRDIRPKRSAIVDLVRKPVNKMKAGLIADLREDILRIANGGT